MWYVRGVLSCDVIRSLFYFLWFLCCVGEKGVHDAAAFWAFSWARAVRAERTRGAS
jgi:hypothetical protein